MFYFLSRTMHYLLVCCFALWMFSKYWLWWFILGLWRGFLNFLNTFLGFGYDLKSKIFKRSVSTLWAKLCCRYLWLIIYCVSKMSCYMWVLISVIVISDINGYQRKKAYWEMLWLMIPERHLFTAYKLTNVLKVFGFFSFQYLHL